MDAAHRLERQLEAAQQITHIGSWEWDVATGTVTWSNELYRIYGLEPGSVPITLESFLSRVHPEDRDRVQREIGGALERGGRFAHRERILRPDGTVRDLDTVGEVVKDAAGRPVTLIGTCRDVTEERRRDETIRLYADAVERVQIGLSVWRKDAAGGFRLVAFNAAAQSAIGRSLDGAIERSPAEIFPEADELPALLASVDDATPVRELEAVRFEKVPHARVFALKAFVLPDRGVGLAFEDVTARVRGARLQAGEQQALELLAAGARLHDILAVIVQLVEELSPRTHAASILLVDEQGTHLRHGAAPSLPEEFNRAVDGAPITPTAGSCGTAAFRREPVFVDDIELDPLWDEWRHLARPYGLRACWSTPILATDGRVLGTFALYAKAPCKVDDATLALIHRATHIARIAIERRQLDDQLRALSGRMEAAREEERTSIAREIHDELGQALTALRMDIAWLARHGAGEAKLAEMTALTDGIIASVRRISTELRPGILDDLGLLAAIEWQTEELTARTGIRCDVHSNLGERRLERNLATAIFRILQEALTNVTRHAQATAVSVDLRLDGGRIVLEVADNGVGVPARPRRGALGLLGMQERAERLGGTCTIGRGPERGTLVTLSLPARFAQERRTDADSPIGR